MYCVNVALVSCDSEINDCSFFTAHFEYPCTQVVCLHRCLVVTSGVFTSLFGCYKWCIYIAVWLLQVVYLHRCLVVTSGVFT